MSRLRDAKPLPERFVREDNEPDMCGIAGLYSYRDAVPDAAKRTRAMSDALAHRGPDDSGLILCGRDERGWRVQPLNGANISQTSSLTPKAALAHRRLSIIDLSPAGHQPMTNADGSIWVTFNGEIYNFQKLRQELEDSGYAFRSQSDTEVLVHGYAAWGERLVERVNGIFAFAILDARHDDGPQLFLARDRHGVKPLYYTERDGTFMFASEIKALLAAGYPPVLDLPAMDAYLTFQWAPEPHTLVQGVRKLPAAHWARVSARGMETHRYWDLRLTQERKEDERMLAAELRERLESAVARQTVADVPVAAFLSGGLDSSAIVALMCRTGHAPVKAYSVGFSAKEQRYEGFSDDLRFARQVATAYGVEQEESVVRRDMLDMLPELIRYLDEPLADPAILPLYAMCESARPHTKVLLSGMGGDELFGGYRRHQAVPWMEIYNRLPRPVRKYAIGTLAEKLPSAGRHRLAPTMRRARRLLTSLAEPPERQYVALASWSRPDERRRLYSDGVRHRLNSTHAWDTHLDALSTLGDASLLEQMLYGDTMLYLPGHNLNYTDKMSMAASVEVRVPFLDNEVVDFIAAVPERMKVRRGRTKHLLREAVRDVVPDSVLNRSKAGLGAPIRAWLSEGSHQVLEDALSPQTVQRHGLFDPEAVAANLNALRSGREDTSYTLWALVTLHLWMDSFDVQVPA